MRVGTRFVAMVGVLIIQLLQIGLALKYANFQLTNHVVRVGIRFLVVKQILNLVWITMVSMAQGDANKNMLIAELGF